MGELMILASALASIIVLVTLGKINRTLEEMSIHSEANAKIIKGRIENLQNAIATFVGRKKPSSGQEPEVKWKN